MIRFSINGQSIWRCLVRGQCVVTVYHFKVVCIVMCTGGLQRTKCPGERNTCKFCYGWWKLKCHGWFERIHVHCPSSSSDSAIRSDTDKLLWRAFHFYHFYQIAFRCLEFCLFISSCMWFSCSKRNELASFCAIECTFCISRWCAFFSVTQFQFAFQWWHKSSIFLIDKKINWKEKNKTPWTIPTKQMWFKNQQSIANAHFSSTDLWFLRFVCPVRIYFDFLFFSVKYSIYQLYQVRCKCHYCQFYLKICFNFQRYFYFIFPNRNGYFGMILK